MARPAAAPPPSAAIVLAGRAEWEAALTAASPKHEPVCLYCGVPSSVVFCSDECEQLSEWERPGSTDVVPNRFNAFHTIIDTAAFAVLVTGALSLLAL